MYSKVVNIYIKVKYDYSVRKGTGIILMEHRGRQKETYFSTIETTGNHFGTNAFNIGVIR